MKDDEVYKKERKEKDDERFRKKKSLEVQKNTESEMKKINKMGKQMTLMMTMIKKRKKNI